MAVIETASLAKLGMLDRQRLGILEDGVRRLWG